jgi:glucose/arabinose dehydrogenase
MEVHTMDNLTGKFSWIGIVLLGFLALSGCKDIPVAQKQTGGVTSAETDGVQKAQTNMPYVMDVAAIGLNVPWELEVAPDGRLFVTERSGALRVIEKGKLLNEPVITFTEGLYQQAEAGLLGLALDPNFAKNRFMYVYQSYLDGSGQPKNRLLRLVENANKAKVDKVLIDGLPANRIHDGGRVKFGPDGMLYFTNGDSSNPSSAQDVKLLGGKIFRVKADGSIPSDNPFPCSPVYSLGHRNPQGLAWHPVTKKLYSSEHGQVAHDEINLIEAGMNYGWPLVEGDLNQIKPADANKKGPGALTAPILHSHDDTWAPSGIAFVRDGPWANNLLVANLRGEQLLRMVLVPDGKSVQKVEPLFKKEFGRLRSVTVSPDGTIYLLTNNRDGRGTPGIQDDRIIRLKPSS